MSTKFVLLDQALGANSIGCSICAANLKRFYCHFNCDPDQDKWQENPTILPIDKHPDYPTVLNPILSIDANVDYPNLCEIYQSCSAINFVSSLGASASTQGFFNLQSSQGVAQGNLLINFKYLYEPSPTWKPFTIPVNKCDADFSNTCTDKAKTTGCVDPQGYSLFQSGTCPCLTCQKACKPFDYSNYLEERTLASGFNWVP